MRVIFFSRLNVLGLSLSQIVHFTPMFAAMLLEWLQECVPLRVKGIYFVNNSYAFNILFKVFKPFIQAKLRKRVSQQRFKLKFQVNIFF
jgi:hypothetical protein